MHFVPFESFGISFFRNCVTNFFQEPLDFSFSFFIFQISYDSFLVPLCPLRFRKKRARE